MLAFIRSPPGRSETEARRRPVGVTKVRDTDPVPSAHSVVDCIALTSTKRRPVTCGPCVVAELPVPAVDRAGRAASTDGPSAFPEDVWPPSSRRTDPRVMGKGSSTNVRTVRPSPLATTTSRPRWPVPRPRPSDGTRSVSPGKKPDSDPLSM